MSDFSFDLAVDDLQLDLSDLDFDLGVSDSQILSATQLLELTVSVNDSKSGQFDTVSKPVYSDISDDELITVSSCFDNLSDFKDENIPPQFSMDVSDAELVAASCSVDAQLNETKDSGCRKFKNPVSSDRLAKIQAEQFAKRSVDKSVWAVTLFGEWRCQRNVRCLSDHSMVYMDKPFSMMTDEELAYTVPLFVAEVLKKDGSEYPPATLRDLVLSLQKHLEVNGRRVHFLTDEKFRPIRDTLDGLMKERARDGLGLKHRQAEVRLLNI